MQKKGVFLVIEGLDGSGKTTQVSLLAKRLSKNYKIYLTAEPSKGKVGSFIREACLYEKQRLPIEVEALLFAADRLEHIQNELKPALNEDRVVICDRYVYSSLAYQGSSGSNLEWVKTINNRAIKPDIGIFIDAAPETVLKRLNRKKSVMETLEIQQKVRENYLKFVENGELIRINGNKPKEVIAKELYSVIDGFLKSTTSATS